MRLLLPADQPRAELRQLIIVTMVIIAIIYWTLTVGRALLGVFHGNGASPCSSSSSVSPHPSLLLFESRESEGGSGQKIKVDQMHP